MTRDIVYEVKYLKHCILASGIVIRFCNCRVLSHCDLCWNQIPDKFNYLFNKGQSQTCLRYTITYRYYLMRFLQYSKDYA